MFLPHPRGFRDPARVAERVGMLDSAEPIQPLRAWADDLALRRGVHVPQFDPAEAGVNTKLLFLFETPGPMTNAGNKRAGSGFISVDNDDATAEAMWRARDDAGLHDGVLCWNIVPWYLGVASRKPTSEELAAGAEELVGLINLLPRLELVALSGRFAQTGWRRHIAKSVPGAPEAVEIWHPSPLALNQPGKRDEFRSSIQHISEKVAQ